MTDAWQSDYATSERKKDEIAAREAARGHTVMFVNDKSYARCQHTVRCEHFYEYKPE